jgi:hypothetical protein
MGWYTYVSDNGNPYTVKLSAAVATAGGFSSTSPPLGGSQPVWPWHARDMRHVTGVAGTKRARCPMALNVNALYQSGGSFTIAAGTFTVTGAEGENRRATNVA